MRATLVFLTLLAAPPAGALDPATPQAYSVHDLDRDGYLSREEYAALRAQHQARRNHAGRPQRAPLLEFDALDSNQDGRISEEELLETLRRRYRGGWRNP